MSLPDAGSTRWRCRRGMRELDRLLLGFFDRDYERLSTAEKQVFVDLLELPDPQLLALLLGHVDPGDPTQCRLIGAVRAGALQSRA